MRALVRRVGALGLASLLAAAVAAGASQLPPSSTGTPEQPNIVLVMTDDMDLGLLDSVDGLPSFETECAAEPGAIMPCLNEHFIDAGVEFRSHAVAHSLCCPSRAAYISGQFGHNNGVRANFQYDSLDKDNILPVFLQNAGYTTAYAGKYQGPSFQGHGHADHRSGIPAGWDQFYGLIDINVTAYQYYGYIIDTNGPTPELCCLDYGLLRPYGHTEMDYQTDVLTGLATSFIEVQEADDDDPFFLSIGYVAPHWAIPPGSAQTIELEREGNGQFESNMVPPPPAPRHLDELESFTTAGIDLPRTSSVNEEDVADKPTFVQNRQPLSDAVLARMDRWYRHRLASLLAVDEGLLAIRDALEAAGELDNTIFIFTSDNGWLQGEHRLAFEKVHVYDESTLVPLVIAGPGVAAGAKVTAATSNIDIPATIMDLAGASPTDGYELDGMSLAPYLATPDEYEALGRVVFHETTENSSGYVAGRFGPWKYVEYANGDRELYNLAADPHELTSLHDWPAHQAKMETFSQHLEHFRDCHGQDGESACVVFESEVASEG